MIRGLLIDSDDTLTRAAGGETIYTDAARNAYLAVMAEVGRAPDPALESEKMASLLMDLYQRGECFYTYLADHHDVPRQRIFELFHEHIDESGFSHDVDAGAALCQLKVPALIFTDASRWWTERRAALIGHGLPAHARDDDPAFERKAKSTARWQRALSVLSELAGATLAPADVAAIDDSAAALRQARALGFRTVHCHYGWPQRDHTTEFDFSVRSVGDFLNDQGLVL